MQKGVADDNGEWNGIIDFFSDIPLHLENAFGGIGLENDMSNFNSYLQDVADLNDYASKEITDIFRDVQNVEWRYHDLIENVNQQMRDYMVVVKKLKESISDPGFKDNYAKAKFLEEIPDEMQRLIGAQWRSILRKDVEDITDEEFIMIAEYLIQSGDEELLEEMISQCYVIKEPGRGIKNPIVYQDATGHIIEKYYYTATKKLDRLAVSVCTVASVWTSVEQNWEEGDKELQWVYTAIQYSAFMKAMQRYGELEIVTETSNYGQGTRTYMNEKLIDIFYNPDGSISAEMYPYYMSVAYTLEGESTRKTILTVSGAEEDANGQDMLIEQAFHYVNAYAGNDDNVPEAMSKELVSQIAGSLLGKIPGESELAALMSIVNAGEKAMDTTIADSEQIAGWGRVVDEFSLICVGTDINQDTSQYSISLYGSQETQRWIEAYNTFMEQNPNVAARVGYPEDGLSISYILNPDNTDEVVNILENVRETEEYYHVYGQIKEIYDGIK